VPLPLAPNERLTGTPEQRRSLCAHLSTLRTGPAACHRHPHLSFTALADLLASPPRYFDPDVLAAGLAITRERLRDSGLTSLLPSGRAWIGTASADPAAFGGFHYPGQGYLHWQMAAVITRLGPLGAVAPACPQLAALDLIRAYAHDSLHYGSYRQYQWHDAAAAPVRVRYGINFRRPDGTTYSRPDPPGSTTTRNLGIIMEGATDREAQAITRRTADLTGITPPPGHPARAAFHDATGQLATASGPIAVGAPPVSLPAFLARMDAYHRTVTAPYTAFLSEINPRDPAALHDAILAAIITGSLASLNTALNQIHGPAAFTRLFHANPCTTTRAAV